MMLLLCHLHFSDNEKQLGMLIVDYILYMKTEKVVKIHPFENFSRTKVSNLIKIGWICGIHLKLVHIM